jgi:hypothetical protein
MKKQLKFNTKEKTRTRPKLFFLSTCSWANVFCLHGVYSLVVVKFWKQCYCHHLPKPSVTIVKTTEAYLEYSSLLLFHSRSIGFPIVELDDELS